MTLDAEYEKRLQETISLINSGKKPEKDVKEVTETFQNITGKLHDLASVLFTGDIMDSTSPIVEDDYSKYFPEDTVEKATVTTQSTETSELESRREMCWAMADMYRRNQDARSLQNICTEIQVLDRLIEEFQKLGGKI